MSRARNVLLITADQWRGDCLSALGHAVRTPRLDALARGSALGDVEGACAGTATLVADTGGCFLKTGGGAAIENDMRTLGRERGGHGKTEPARRSGDERDAAVERKHVRHDRRSSPVLDECRLARYRADGHAGVLRYVDRLVASSIGRGKG